LPRLEVIRVVSSPGGPTPDLHSRAPCFQQNAEGRRLRCSNQKLLRRGLAAAPYRVVPRTQPRDAHFSFVRHLERQLHHYGSSLNAIPLLAEYREHPDDFYLLRVGYGGTMGTLTDIDEEGFLACAFHAFPDLLRPDGISGDDGPNLFGHAWNMATYVAHHPEFGWVAFGGNIHAEGQTVKVAPLDSFRMRVYLASAGLWLTLDSGQFDAVEWNTSTGAIRVGLAPATHYLHTARLRVEQQAKVAGAPTYQPAGDWKQERDAYVILLGTGTTWVDLAAGQ
jgi:hypothetical protein